MRWETADRYYLAVLQQDLLGDWVVFLAWGGKNCQRGNSQSRPVKTLSEGLAVLAEITRKRQQHGYVQVA